MVLCKLAAIAKIFVGDVWCQFWHQSRSLLGSIDPSMQAKGKFCTQQSTEPGIKKTPQITGGF
jgi:hypothetical protein